MATICLVLTLSLLGLATYRAQRVWIDAGPLADGLGRRVRWTLLGTLFPARYWWQARIEALSDEDRENLLAGENAALGLSQADAERCPLCGAELSHAWAVFDSGRADGIPVDIAPGPVQCPSCDFRLDACRHCTRFSPGGPPDWSRPTWAGGDLSSGRCTHYRSVQPVEVACAAPTARHLKRRGYDQLRAPLPIVDSYLPPDSCRAFRADRRRLQTSGIRWPDARRTALLRLQADSRDRPAGLANRSVPDQKLPGADEAWLL